MANQYSQKIAWQLKRGRDLDGVRITFNDTDYRATTETTSGANCGMQGLSSDIKNDLLQYEASLDPRIFVLSPQDFDPITDVLCPQEGDSIIWHSLEYLVTRLTFDDLNDDTIGIQLYCLRKIF